MAQRTPAQAWSSTPERFKRRWLLDGLYEIIATFLLTGGRKAEVLGLLVWDVNLDTDIVQFRPNGFRPLKTPWAERTVPLWPQLREILTPWIEGRDPKALLFQSPAHGMIHDLRRALEAISTASGTTVTGVTIFRHTYATARLQTTDNGKQIALWTVAKELRSQDCRRVWKIPTVIPATTDREVKWWSTASPRRLPPLHGNTLTAS